MGTFDLKMRGDEMSIRALDEVRMAFIMREYPYIYTKRLCLRVVKSR